ncbi:putative membrane protein [Aliivibrio salmonicida LFI1238]|uniref:Membrane protein n=1 Tax=Aliivibrio salmonicida (strain LFI1238) TaxID=316275 RepID=B6EHE5_ALISL|nr:putative membrane protein [Aliivibrio salmonicida LFI1238]
MLLWSLLPDLYLFDKIPSQMFVLQVFIFFVILFYKTIRNNFVRCYKVEPFVTTASLESTFLPVVFFIGLQFIPDYAFSLCTTLMSFFLIWTLRVECKFMESLKND